MKRWILLWSSLLLMVGLVACGKDAAPTATSTNLVTPTPVPTARPRATDTSPPPEPTRTPAPPAPRSTERSSLGLEKVFPRRVEQTTLGASAPVCVGEGIAVVEETVYTLGRRDDQPCASAIDLTSGAVASVDPATLPAFQENVLQVAHPSRGHIYGVEEGRVLVYDTEGQPIGTLLVLPPGEPAGFSTTTGLRLDEAAERLYVSYQDFDGQAWIATTTLAADEAVVDVPILPGPWTLGADGRLFFADADTLLVRDGTTLAVTERLSLARRPVDAALDPDPDGDGARLFVTDAGGDLHVLDPASLVEQTRLPGLGAAVDLDPRLGRLYVGDRYSGGVHVLDLKTLQALGRIPQPGEPIASPADGQVYILEEAVYRADGATLALVTGRTRRNSGCNGCSLPTDVVVDPTSGLVYTPTYGVWIGKPGRASRATVDPHDGRAFVARTSGGYQVVYSLALYPDLTLGQPTRWVDGLYGQPLYNPFTEQLYLASGGRLLLLDGRTLELLGGVGHRSGAGTPPTLTLLAAGETTGWLYAAQGEHLLRFEPDATLAKAAAQWEEGEGEEWEEGAGGSALPVLQNLPGPVYGIAVSPHFAQDDTLFARATDLATGYGDLYRSRDGGESWTPAGEGLPGPPADLAFGSDGRLYAALAALGWRATPEAASWGEGVYVSEDGGETWRPDNAGLTHLRVAGVQAAPNGTLYALAASAIGPNDPVSGPTVWTRASDATWSPLPVPDAGPLRLENHVIPTSYTQAVQAYWHELAGGGPLYQGWADELRRSDDGGRTWRTVGHGPADYAEDVVRGPQSTSVYWLGPQALWRSTDEGETWAALRHPALEEAPPFLVTVTEVEGAETLFLGTEEGRVLVVPVDEGAWESPSAG